MASLATTVATLPRFVCQRDAQEFFDGELETQAALGSTVAHSIVEHREKLFYKTGSVRFDGQSAIAIYHSTSVTVGNFAPLDSSLSGCAAWTCQLIPF